MNRNKTDAEEQLRLEFLELITGRRIKANLAIDLIGLARVYPKSVANLVKDIKKEIAEQAFQE